MMRVAKKKKTVHLVQGDIQETRLYLRHLKKKGMDQIILGDILQEGLEFVRTACGLKAKSV
jgi:hypothetical protein